MSASNYARRTSKRGEPLEVRFFLPSDEVPRPLLAPPWVWWAVPRDYHEVRLIGEAPDERCKRLSHAPGECEECRTRRLRSS